MQNRSLLLLASQVWQRRNRHCRVSGVCLQQGHFEGALYCSQPSLQTLVWQDPALNSPWPMSAASQLLVLSVAVSISWVVSPGSSSGGIAQMSTGSARLLWSFAGAVSAVGLMEKKLHHHVSSHLRGNAQKSSHLRIYFELFIAGVRHRSLAADRKCVCNSPRYHTQNTLLKGLLLKKFGKV